MAGERDEINYVKEAFQWQYNVIGMLGAGAFAVLSGTAVPLVLAAGAELMYLATVPQMSRFQRLVRSWKFSEEQKQRDDQLRQMLYMLPEGYRNRYGELRALADSIGSNYRRLSANSQMFLDQLQQQLNGLLASFIRLSQAAVLHHEYLTSTKPDDISREANDLRQRLAKDPLKVQEINKKRIEILEKRLDKYGKIRENRQVIDAQLQAIQDVLNLIRDQSMTMTDPQQVSDRLDSLVKDVEHTEQTIQEMEAIFQLSPQADASLSGDSSAAMRDRLRS
ncbi:MAG: hypothetical protein U0Q16_10200 [Bryobacteraceae bacterium]